VAALLAPFVKCWRELPTFANQRAMASGAAAFRHRDFRFYMAARACWMLGLEALNVAVGWQIYSVTHRPLDLGLVGLAQFAPFFGFTLVSGTVADRFDRRAILLACHAVLGLSALALFLQSHLGTSVPAIYGALVVVGTARAFSAPVSQAFLPDLVPKEDFQNAVAWGGSVMKVANIAGPAVGGLLYGFSGGAGAVYLLAFGLEALVLVFVALIRVRTGRMERKATSWTTVLAGVRYVWKQRPILGAISLDMFAVLLGGAVALLPVYARDILHTGPWGLGLLRSAPALGATIVALVLAARPLKRHTGAWMFVCVGIFGLSTIGFGLSTHFWSALGWLVLVGASDMVSMYVRGTLVQLATPPQMRGRVSAVNMLFIGASNELGEFESGVTAQWLGAVRAVVLGGLGTIVVVAVYASRFPQLRKVDRLEDIQPLGE
jgi:MFS family permease